MLTFERKKPRDRSFLWSRTLRPRMVVCLRSAWEHEGGGIRKKSPFLLVCSSEVQPGWIGEVMKHRMRMSNYIHVSGRMNIVEIMLLLSATVIVNFLTVALRKSIISTLAMQKETYPS